MRKIFLALFMILSVLGISSASAAPLTVHPDNPRYFTDGSGKAVYLTGSHTWANFMSWGTLTNSAINFTDYLNWLESKNHNTIRLWVTDTAWRDSSSGPGACEPQPFVRTGPGDALRGGLKFDLNSLNQAYFDRLNSYVNAANNRGMYVIVMLFDTWGVNGYGTGSGTWSGNPFNINNNKNKIDGDTNGDERGLEVHTLAIPAITTIQEAYVSKVIDTVNGFDNVLYEVINEGDCSSKDWQYHFIDYIRNYEAGKPKQHLVGINGLCSTDALTQQMLFSSTADFVSPLGLGSSALYAINPPASDGSKVIITDTDHIEYPRDSADPLYTRIWVWKSFVRGLNPILMDHIGELTGITHSPEIEANRENARRTMGHTLIYANKMNLASMTPSTSISSTGYCLANPGQEYLAYQPGSGAFTVNLQAGTYSYEWFNPSTGSLNSTGTVTTSGGSRSFTPPFSGDAVLYLKVQASSCGNSQCDSGECSTCPGDCILSYCCGREGCNSGLGENCSTCPQDCGACPSQDPIAWWKFDETSGTTASDSSGNQTGTLVNGSAWTTGRLSGAVSLDGADDYVSLGTSTMLDFPAGSNFTVTGWTKTSESQGTVLSWRNSGEEGAIIDVSVGYDGVVTDSGKLMALVRQNLGINGYARLTGGLVNNGQWHYFALTRNSGTIQLYLDSASQGTASGAESSGQITTNLRSIGSEGRWVQDSYGTADQRFLAGSADDVRIYNRALSPEEVQTLYNSTQTFHKSDTNQDGCVQSTELSAFIDLWYLDSSSPTIRELIEAIGFWKRGC